MELVSFDDAETYEPEPGWRRVALAGGEDVSLEYFDKPAGHTSPMHDHSEAQVCLCLQGELRVYTESESVTLKANDSVYLASEEAHRVANETSSPAVGLDIFVPGRSFDFWTDQTE